MVIFLTVTIFREGAKSFDPKDLLILVRPAIEEVRIDPNTVWNFIFLASFVASIYWVQQIVLNLVSLTVVTKNDTMMIKYLSTKSLLTLASSTSVYWAKPR